jgi:hypothetical protein
VAKDHAAGEESFYNRSWPTAEVRPPRGINPLHRSRPFCLVGIPGPCEGVIDQPQKFAVPERALAGAAAEVVVTPGGTPHVWASTPALVVTSGGDAKSDQLTRMIASLR